MPFVRNKFYKGRGMGLVSAPVAGGLVYGSSAVPVGRPAPYRPIGGPVPIVDPVRVVGPVAVGPSGWNPPGWQQGPPGSYGSQNPWQNGGGSGWQNTGGQNSLSNAQALQAAQALYSTNADLLSPQQWTLLQNAGIIPSTLPYSSAGLVNTAATAASATSGAIDPTTGVPYATELAEASASSSSGLGALSTDYSGLPLYAWLLGGGVLLYVIMGKRR